MKIKAIKREVEVKLPSKYGNFNLYAYSVKGIDQQHLALVKGTWKKDEPILVRVHSSCVTGEIFGSLKCDCGPQLEMAMKLIEKKGKGVIIYLNQEGRGIGLLNKLKAYKLQEGGLDTVEANIELGFPADARSYEIAAFILKDLGIKKVNLLTNNPDKEKQLITFGINIIKSIILESKPNGINNKYLFTKKNKLKHRLTKV